MFPKGRLIQGLRDITKRVDLQIYETSPGKLVFSETYLSCIWDCNSWSLNHGIFWLPAQSLNILLNYYKKLLIAWFKLENYLRYLNKRKTFVDQIGRIL